MHGQQPARWLCGPLGGCPCPDPAPRAFGSLCCPLGAVGAVAPADAPGARAQQGLSGARSLHGRGRGAHSASLPPAGASPAREAAAEAKARGLWLWAPHPLGDSEGLGVHRVLTAGCSDSRWEMPRRPAGGPATSRRAAHLCLLTRAAFHRGPQQQPVILFSKM